MEEIVKFSRQLGYVKTHVSWYTPLRDIQKLATASANL